MDRAHLLLPYALVAVTGSVVAVQSALGDGIDAVEIVLTWVVLVLVLARQVVTLVQRLRTAEGLLKPPGVAETLDWARALESLGTRQLDVESAARTLGAVVKYREDAQRVRQALDRMLAG